MKLKIDWLSRPMDGELENGDAVLVRDEAPHTLFAIIDALGHGPAAAATARRAVECLAQAPLGEGIERLLARLHVALQQSRGAAATLCLFDGTTLGYGGVGNVELRSHGTRVPHLPSPGILGQRVQRLRTFTAPLKHGDRIILFSDGITARFPLEELRPMKGAAACRHTLDRYGRPHDDATIIVADVESPVGGGS